MVNRTEETKSIHKLRHAEFISASIQRTLIGKILKQIQDDVNRGRFYLPFAIYHLPKAAFTLAEILVTLGIIGVVAALTIPTLMNNIQDLQYKTAYKKAYSELSQAIMSASQQDSLVEVSTSTGPLSSWGNNINLLAIVEQFKPVKKCINNDGPMCWDSTGEQYGKNYAADGRPEANNNLNAFIDASGKAWTTLEWSIGRIAVDTNGFKKPNQYGKDRFVFHLVNDSNSEFSGVPTKVVVYPDNNPEVCTGNKCGTAGNPDYQTYFGTSWLQK